MLATMSIQSGVQEAVVAGGMESMSNAPYCVPKARQGLRYGHGAIEDIVLRDGLWDAFDDHHMGNAAEVCSRDHDISREAQDEFAIQSYKRAQESIEEGRFQDEIVSVTTSKGAQIECDEECSSAIQCPAVPVDGRYSS